MKHLFFCRHGLSEANKAGLFAGQTETPLAEEGKEQARIAGEHAQSLHLDHIISSPFSRAHDTARIIAQAIGYPEHKIELNSLLIERHLGALEGQPYLADLDLDMDGIADIETYDDLQHRVQMAVKYLESLPYENILVVSHGATGRMFRHVLNHEVPFWSPDPFTRESNRFANAEIVELV